MDIRTRLCEAPQVNGHRNDEKYVIIPKGSIGIVTHPTTGVQYFMIPTQATPESARTVISRFTWFTMRKVDGIIKTLLEEQGMKDVEYLTALSPL